MEFDFPLILDGATGTELNKRGFDGSVPAELWSLEHPDEIISLQKGYIEAGSMVVYTPTFGANRKQLDRNGLGDRVTELNIALAQLSLRAADGRAMVAGDIAPTGLFTRPAGAFNERLADIYDEQARALDRAGVDLFVIETMMSLADAVSAVTAVRSFSDKPVFVSCTVDDGGKMLDGSDILHARDVLCGMDIDVFGLNCSMGPAQMKEQIAAIADGTPLPLLAKPNAGLPVIRDGRAEYDCTAQEFAGYMKDMQLLGVKVFGGCCGTDSGFIAAIRDALRG